MSRDNGFVTVLVEFGRALRAKGLPSAPGDILTYCAAMAPLDPTDLVDLYWAGRTTLVSAAKTCPSTTRSSARSSSAADAPVQQLLKRQRRRPRPKPRRRCQMPGSGAGQGAGRGSRSSAGWRPTSRRLKHRSFGACTAEELAALRTDHDADPADPAAPPHPAHQAGPRRPQAGPAPDDPGVDAHARRDRRAVLAARQSGCGR